MRGDLNAFEIERPKSLAQALTLLARADRPMPIAGGTDLYVGINDGKPRATRYLDLSLLRKQLRGITLSRAGFSLGALTTYTDLRGSAAIAKNCPVLAKVARDVGAIAIQNRGTLGGSLGNASPASDPAPVLLALDAHLELAHAGGKRILPLSEFFLGYRKTALRPDELIVSILIPRERYEGWKIGYRKVGTRRAQAISKVVVATAVKIGKGDRVEGARLCFGSVAATSVRARAAEALLLGEVLDAKSILAAQEALSADVKPIDDIRSTAAYRMHVARNLLAAQLNAARSKR